MPFLKTGLDSPTSHETIVPAPPLSRVHPDFALIDAIDLMSYNWFYEIDFMADILNDFRFQILGVVVSRRTISTLEVTTAVCRCSGSEYL